jgi:Bacterial capsule synthesis protein PGA_cap
MIKAKFMELSKFSLVALAATTIVRCIAPNQSSNPDAVVEGAAWYQSKINTSAAAPLSTNKDEALGLLDIRGVGDSGVNVAGLANTQPLWRGDLGFINFESVVSPSCTRRNEGVDFFFRSDPAQIRLAKNQGFNIFSVANNHSRDCFEPYGPTATAASMTKLTQELGILWHGTSATDPYQARIGSFSIKGRTIRVAFAAIAIQPWSMKGVAEIVVGSETANKPDMVRLLSSLQKANADFRVLSIHTQDSSGNGRSEGPAFQTLKSVAQSFINNYNGNIVFGSGPHTQAGVKVVERSDGRKGVIFTSLGNFLHPGLGGHSDNYLGRAAFDLENNFQLKFVQVFPLSNIGGPAIRYHMDARNPMSNFTWTKGSTSYHASF